MIILKGTRLNGRMTAMNNKSTIHLCLGKIYR